jgi:hypothetical protein
MELNDFGYIVQHEIIKTEQMRPNVKIDEYVIMPDHCHVIYHICHGGAMGGEHRGGTLQRAPTTQSKVSGRAEIPLVVLKEFIPSF